MKNNSDQHKGDINQILYSIANAVNNTSNLDQLFLSIHTSLSHIIDVSQFHIALFDETRKCSVIVFDTNTVDNLDIVEIPLNGDKHSFTSEVIKTGKTLMIANDEIDASIKKSGKPVPGDIPKQWMAVPLKIEDRVIGAMATQSYKSSSAFDLNDLKIFEIVSDQIAIAIKKKISEDEMIQNEKTVKTLLTISNAVSTSTSIDELFQSIHTSLQKIIDVENFHIALYNKENNSLSLAFNTNKIDNLGNSEIPIDGDYYIFTAEVIKKGVPFLLSREERIEAIKNSGKKGMGVISEQWMAVPLIINDEVIGAMATQSYESPNQYSREDLLVFESVSDQIAIAISRKKIEEDLIQSEKKVTTLLEISNAMNKVDNLDDLYPTIYKSLKKGIDISEFFIALYHEESDSITFPYLDDSNDSPNNIYHPLLKISDNTSPTGEVVLTKKPVILNKQEMLNRVNEDGKTYYGTATEAWIGIPLEMDGKVLGVMAIFSYEDANQYTDHDIMILEAASKQIAIGISKKLAEEDLRLSEKKVKTLLEISNTINNTESLEELYKNIHVALSESIKITEFCFALYNRESDYITFPYFQDSSYDYNIFHNVTKNTSPTGEVILSGKPLYLNKKEMLKRLSQQGKTFYGTATESWIGVPLEVDGIVIGAMVIYSYDDENQYTQNDIMIFEAASKQVANAISKKKAEEELIQSEKTIKALYNISNAVNTSYNLSELYTVIHSALDSVIDVPNFYISTYDEKNDIIDIPYVKDSDDKYLVNPIKNVKKTTSLTGEVILAGKPILLYYDQIIERSKESGKTHYGRIPKVWLGSPLKTRGKVLGAIVAQDYNNADKYSKSDINIFEMLGEQIASAIYRKRTEEDLSAYREQLEILSKQTENFSMEVADMISMDEEDFFDEISRAIIKHSDFQRVVISYFESRNTSRKILSYRGVEKKYIEYLENKRTNIGKFEKVLALSKKIGIKSFFLHHSNNDKNEHVANDSDTDEKWHTKDNLFVRMDDKKGNLIGVISVDTSKSGDLPTSETVKPLEMFAGLISQIIIYKKSQADLAKAKEEAEKNAKIKSMFLANMSHEIRTPMNSIIGFNNLILKTGLSEQQRNYAEKMKYSSNMLLGIINDVLDFSKIEAGKMKLESIPFNLRNILKSVIDMFFDKTEKKGIFLNLIVDEQIPDVLIGDPLRLRQVLVNLMGNAVKFTSEGEIEISVTPDDISFGRVCLTFNVSDSGIGIPENLTKDLFSSFSQADNSTTREFGGTGLGLSISKKLINLMGGNIWLTSEYHKGSKFSFRLSFLSEYKISKKDAFKEVPAIKDYYDISGKKLLLVEDNKINRQVAIEVLNLQGVEVSIAKNGIEAVEKVKNNDFDIVLMDVQMPEMDGYTATEIIKNELNMKYLPIVAMTAYVQEEDRLRCFEAGMDDYITKPIVEEELYTKVNFWVSQKEKYYSQDNVPAVKETLENQELYGLNTISKKDIKFNLDKMQSLLDNRDLGSHKWFLSHVKTSLNNKKLASDLNSFEKHLFRYEFEKAEDIFKGIIAKI
ncbi:MAG: GAF domain-containing protein [Desulfobacterales bacterium]|nr:GAF domain-containing protein [Desulfobacterales bacterium]